MSIERRGYIPPAEEPKQEPEPQPETEVEAAPDTERGEDLWVIGYDQHGYARVADVGSVEIPDGAETWQLGETTLIYDPSRVEFHEEHNLDERVEAAEIDAKLFSEGWDWAGKEEQMPHEVSEVYIRTKK